jgi:hypothetical protein
MSGSAIAADGGRPPASEPATKVDAAPPPSAPQSADPRVERRAQAAPAPTRGDWKHPFATLFGLLGDRQGAPAPVEERNARSSASASASARQGNGARAPLPPAPTVIAQTRPTAPVVPVEPAPAVVAPAPAVVSPPVLAASPVPSTMPAPPVQVAPERPIVAQKEEPRASPKDLAAGARQLLSETVPRVVAQAEPELSRVLSTAAFAYQPAQARLVADAADGPWPSESALMPRSELPPSYARGLHAEARRALAAGRGIADVVELEMQAFAANPRDPEIAGYLAYLHLRMRPTRPEVARELAVHAIVFSGSRRSARIADWATFAIASALTGRDDDARRAYLVQATLTDDVEWTCRSALRAYAAYGEPVRVPVQAMLQRIHAQRRAFDAPACAWPPFQNASSGAPAMY